jgi:hypothetical protein
MSRADLPALLSEVTSASNPVEMIRDLVLQTGGFWQEAGEKTGLFEIQLAGIIGLGPSAEAAVDDWLMQARRAKADGVLSA